MRRSSWFIVEILLATLLAVAEMPGQSAATVNGVVQDSSGAVIVQLGHPTPEMIV